MQPKLVTRIKQAGVPLVVLTHTLTEAARSVLFDDPPRKFLAIEKCGDGSVAYYPDNLAGERLTGEEVWALDTFISTLLEA